MAAFNYPINPGWRADINTNLTYMAGDHELKFGNQFIRSNVTTGATSTADPPLVAIFANGVPNSVNTWNTPATSTGKILTDGIYIQDKWKPARKLTVNLGLRFDYQLGWMEDGKSPLCQVQTVFIAAQCFPAVKDAPNSKVIVPRTSLVYDVFGNGKTGLKFSANKYHGTDHDHLSHPNQRDRGQERHANVDGQRGWDPATERAGTVDRLQPGLDQSVRGRLQAAPCQRDRCRVRAGIVGTGGGLDGLLLSSLPG